MDRFRTMGIALIYPSRIFLPVLFFNSSISNTDDADMHVNLDRDILSRTKEKGLSFSTEA